MHKTLAAIFVSFLMLGFQTTFVLAADEHPVAASHGGQVSKVGPYYVELVAKDGEIKLYLTDDKNNKISTEYGRAKATIRYGGDKRSISIDLKVAEGNSLQGHGNFEIESATAIVVFVKLGREDAHGGFFGLNNIEASVENNHHDDDDHQDNHDSHGH